jgi:hypothetical protein
LKLEDLFGEEISERIKTRKLCEHKKPKVQPKPERKTKFERDVFNYFLAHKKELEIIEVFPFENMYVDGALKLTSGKAIALEIKENLDWVPACHARIEVQNLQKDSEKWDYFALKVSKTLNGALIMFKKFGLFWKVDEKGWDAFYEEEARIGNPAIPIRIAQLTQEKLEFGDF